MKKQFFIFIVLIIANSTYILAQTSQMPPFKQYDPDVVALIDKAKTQMTLGDFDDANNTFRKALATKKVLPASMSYFFAETLFVIHQNQNARNFVEKYIELVGQGGDYYDKAVNLKSLIDAQFQEIKNCEHCNLSGYRYIVCDNCNALGHTVETCHTCRGNGLLMCPKCVGRGVLISANAFQEKKYSSCDLCNSKGYITCTTCNGTKELSGRCNICLGTGKKVSKTICNHQTEQ